MNITKLSPIYFLWEGVIFLYISFKLSRKSLFRAAAIPAAVIIAASTVIKHSPGEENTATTISNAAADFAIAENKVKKDYIKWVEFNVPYEVLEKAMRLDINSVQSSVHINWIEVLSYLGARYGGDFKSYKEKDLNEIAERLSSGEKIESITQNMKYYSYYKSAYTAVLGEFLGYFKEQTPCENSNELQWAEKYGLKVFSPIARGYGYSHYTDFGASRSYGYKRKHLGHDMMGNVGTPIIAIESGRIEALGWNRYGGWRIGIRSFDSKRYYYYAHLRKNHPYPTFLGVGSIVKAGDIIGYMGMTGYSSKENVNNIDTPHLHMGIQLIFDESQKEGNNEIWIDCYEITKLLAKHTSAAVKNEQTGEYERKYDFFEASVENTE